MNSKSMKWTFTGLAAATAFATGVVASADSYTVKSGDTLSGIAKEKNTTVEKLAQLNKLDNPDMITVGQVLELDENAEAQAAPAQDSASQTAVASQVEVAPVTAETYSAPAADYSAYSSSVTLANGNTAGATGSYAAARMAELTGVPASTWENIIARESNGQVNAYNPSGASGLFQTMPGWGSTATVDDQIAAAQRAYNAQGLSAWGY
ncbi:LysM peptidoglycan-binding domain-containing protein [Streptococcus oricebi]|uniref:Peptidoglycan-binding protein n=1 Tax=Streptococcus oricebi TaxID=1547447 RepID=A0ABS5B5L8_9STRE|nr:LysM peptidoglycan-binding domain-containing protein [Streptococcus oricebi]MBP2624129.1 peptidoglycan-binding protein [Streptococcus oricebi]